MDEQFDVIIVGAGISGIDAAHHLMRECPDLRFAILEGRDTIGGTWDLFRYPGIRSDSDMFTLGFPFRPWRGEKAIADGGDILDYLRDTVRDEGIDRHIRLRHRVRRAEWSSDTARWTVEAECDGATQRLQARFLYLCSGYYDYDHGHAPDFPGAETFAGTVVHPQFWPQALDWSGRRIVVIGSGATAMTLVPALAGTAGHVTMLQRSPTYVVARPARDALAAVLRHILPAGTAHALTRWRSVLVQQFFYTLMRRRPEAAKERLVGMVREAMGPEYDVATHFTPRYNPWDQRLCLVPDGDLFDALRAGKAEVVTDTIDRFVPEGIALGSGRVLPADIIITATGLKVKLMGGIDVAVDGEPVRWAERLTYKGMMFSGLPNLALAFGYTNASWTLKADLTARYVTRLLKAMARRGMRQVMPMPTAPVDPAPFLDFTSGYVRRAIDDLPRQGTRRPWRLHQNYLRDLMLMRFGSLDEEMVFSNPEVAPAAGADAAPAPVAAPAAATADSG